MSSDSFTASGVFSASMNGKWNQGGSIFQFRYENRLSDRFNRQVRRVFLLREAVEVEVDHRR